MEHTVYFADKAVCFAAQPPVGDWHAVALSGNDDVSRSKIAKILENHNFVALLTPTPQAAFDAFASEFIRVEAAGGVVVNDRGEWLMMRRNGRWDFPKGHLEAGETLAVCAQREVEEETGVAAEVLRPLCRTQHAYYMHDRWELKCTSWYAMHVGACDDLRPQQEEGIEQVAWCAPEQVAVNLTDAFPTIRCVAEALR